MGMPYDVGPDDPPYLRLDGPNQWLPEHVLPGLVAVGLLVYLVARGKGRE